MLSELENAIAEIKEKMPGLSLWENEPMKEHCSFKIGGPVRAFATPSDVFSATRVFSILKKYGVAPLVVGNCSNILFPDEGMENVFVVSTLKLTKINLTPDGAIYAECGVSLASLSTFAQQSSLAGLEFASGIPGTVGGGVRMNAGAYGGELKDTVDSVVFYSLPDQGLYEAKGEDCAFGYRTSVFQSQPFVVLSAVFKGTAGDKSEIAEKMRDFNARRRDKQPLNLPSAGSAFKRPEGYYAAALIQECGLKGYRVGDAQVSEKHSGFVVNLGNATSHDVYDLMMHVRNTVAKEKGVFMEPEIIILPPDAKFVDNTPDVFHNNITQVGE